MKFIVGVIVGLLLVPAGAVLYLKSGRAPVATSAPPFPFEKTIASAALDARVAKEAPKDAPFKADEQTYVEGAQLYRQNCAVCHGMRGQQPTAIAKGMYPPPPQLLKGKGVTDDPPGETYWKVANGIRLTGMPGFGKSVTDKQLWQVSLLLANADKLPAVAQQILSSPAEANRIPTAAARGKN